MDKKTYEAMKDIKRRIAAGEKTTFAERNWLRIIDKQRAKKHK
jgi:hypothetical protein